MRYSPEGASLLNNKLETLWSDIYEMQNPIADVSGSRAVIADRDGTDLEIYDKSGRSGSISTSYSIVKAKISASGLVAAILDGGGDTWINFLCFGWKPDRRKSDQDRRSGISAGCDGF